MTVENTEVRVDWLDGISVKRTDLRPGQIIYLGPVPGVITDQGALNRRIRVNSPDEVDVQIEVGHRWISTSILKEDKINSDGLVYKYNSTNYDPPERTVTVHQFCTWRPTPKKS